MYLNNLIINIIIFINTQNVLKISIIKNLKLFKTINNNKNKNYRYYWITVEPRLSELIGITPNSDRRKFG